MAIRSRKRANATGRNTSRSGAFSMIDVSMQKSEAFQSLSASAIRVLLWALINNYKMATKFQGSGKPSFKLTNSEAKKEYGLNSTTFTNAKNQLEDRGFLEWTRRGGLKGCNGVCSTFCLSGKWKEWVAPQKPLCLNLVKARETRKRNKEDKDYATKYGNNIKNTKPTRRVSRRN